MAKCKLDGVPEGFMPVEAWTNGAELVVLGFPPPEDMPEEEAYSLHNCDDMGCCTFSHVIFRCPVNIPWYVVKDKEAETHANRPSEHQNVRKSVDSGVETGGNQQSGGKADGEGK